MTELLQGLYTTLWKVVPEESEHTVLVEGSVLVKVINRPSSTWVTRDEVAAFEQVLLDRDLSGILVSPTASIDGHPGRVQITPLPSSTNKWTVYISQCSHPVTDPITVVNMVTFILTTSDRVAPRIARSEAVNRVDALAKQVKTFQHTQRLAERNRKAAERTILTLIEELHQQLVDDIEDHAPTTELREQATEDKHVCGTCQHTFDTAQGLSSHRRNRCGKVSVTVEPIDP